MMGGFVGGALSSLSGAFLACRHQSPPIRGPDRVGQGSAPQGAATLERNRGKTPGKQVQHASACGTAAAEIRHFLAVEPGLTRFRSVFARGFAPVTLERCNPLLF